MNSYCNQNCSEKNMISVAKLAISNGKTTDSPHFLLVLLQMIIWDGFSFALPYLCVFFVRKKDNKKEGSINFRGAKLWVGTELNLEKIYKKIHQLETM